MLKRIALLLWVAGALLMAYAAPGLAQTRIPPDLAVAYQSGPTKAQPGETYIFYSVNITNRGGSTAVIPAGTVLARHTVVGAASVPTCAAPNGYYCNNTGNGTFEIVSRGENTLGAGQSIDPYVYVNAPTTNGKMSYSASVDPNDAIAEVSETNNSSNTIATYVGQPPATDLSVTQVDNADPIDVEGFLSYDVTVTNNGQDTAFNVVVEDYLPENATFQGAWNDYYNCNHIPEYKAVVCPMGDIPAGESREMHVFVSPTAAGTISNSATAYSDNGDPNTANDTAKEDTVVQSAPVDEPLPPDPGNDDGGGTNDPPPDTVRPVVTSVAPAADSTTRDRTPTVKATVRDGRTNLVKSNVKLYVDGRRVTTFSYAPSTDRLSYTPGKKLSYGRHTVKIVARDAAGNVATKQWSCKVFV